LFCFSPYPSAFSLYGILVPAASYAATFVLFETRMNIQERLQRLRAELHKREVDAVLISDATNRRYFSGFTGSSGTLLVTADKAMLLSDFRYAEQAPREAPLFEFRLVVGEAKLAEALADLLPKLGAQRLGFEADNITVARLNALKQGLDDANPVVQWHPFTGLAQLRQVKDADELALLRRAIRITDEAFDATIPLMQPTMRERELAWELEKAMRERGADGISFEIIVAAGPNGAQPHARAGDEQLGAHRPIVIDFGAQYAGYHADCTRTVLLGEPDDQFWTIYNMVLHAQEAAITDIRPGMTSVEADATARDLIKAAGYGEQFGHGLGHGVGLDVHEGPRVSWLGEDTLPSGAVFSIEPGIYLPGWGGVRIEDLVLLTDDGPQVLSHARKDPVILIDT
jgi:Xaa-Pro aminopeptidase